MVELPPDLTHPLGFAHAKFRVVSGCLDAHPGPAPGHDTNNKLFSCLGKENYTDFALCPSAFLGICKAHFDFEKKIIAIDR